MNDGNACDLPIVHQPLRPIAAVAVFRPSNGTWYIVNSTAGILIQQFGENEDVPTQTAYNY